MKKLITIAMCFSISTAFLVGCSNSSTNENPIDNNVDDYRDNLVDDYDNNLDFNDGLFENDNYSEKMYQDGVYRAEFKEYIDGYKDYVEITVKDGEIDKVVHDGLKEDGSLKSVDGTLKNQYLERYNTYPSEYMAKYSDHLEKNKSLDNLDIYNDTSDEYNNFKRLAEQALISAKNGISDIAPIDNDMTGY